MTFTRFVETGRVALIADSQDKDNGKRVAIVDIINQGMVVVDGPETGVTRRQIRLNQIHLTKFRIKFPFTASTRVVRKAWKDAKVDEKWAESVWAKKIEAKNKRLEMGDFDRFKLRKARQRRNKARSFTFFRIKKKNARSGNLFGKKTATKGGDKPKPPKASKKAAAPAAAPKK